MKFRSLKQKRYNCISEYYDEISPDKVVTAYYIQYREPGKKNPTKIKACYENGKIATNPDEAKEILDAKLAEIARIKKELKIENNPIITQKKFERMTLDEMATLFFENRTTKNNNLDQNAYFNHTSKILINDKPLGSHRVSTLTTKMIIAARDAIVDSSIISLKTIDNLFGVLKAIFNEGMEEENQWCKRNPLISKKLSKLTKLEDTSRINIFTDVQLKQLFTESEFNPRLNLFYKLAYHTGARPDAILTLQVKDIDFDNRRIHLKSMKDAPAYNIPLNSDIAEIVKRWISKHSLNRREHYLFYPHKNDKRYALDERKKRHIRYEGIRKISQKLMDTLFNIYDVENEDGNIETIYITERKERYSMYTLRHTATTNLVRKFGIHSAKEYLKHSDIRMTENYAKVIEEQMQEMAESLKS